MPGQKRFLSYAMRTMRRRVRGKYAVRSKRAKGYRAYKLAKTVMGSAKYNLHSYIRWAEPDSTPHTGTQLSPGTTTTSCYGKAFALNVTVSSPELTALYDQYMIKGVKVMFQLVSNPDASTSINSGASSNHNNFFPKLWYVRDYDNVTEESLESLKQRNNAKCIVLNPNRMYSVYVRPAIRNQVFLDGVTTATSPVWNQWLDCNNAGVPHYGLKWVIATEGFTPTQTWNVRVEYKYYIKFKNAR